MEENKLKNIIEENQSLIYSIASKFRGDIEDLFQVGCIGIMKAYENYDFNKQTKFTTYAYTYIFGEIYKYVLRNKNIKLTHDQVKLNSAINKARDFLTQKLSREPTNKELADFLEIPDYKIVEIQNIMEVYSLDDVNDDISLYDLIGFSDMKKDDLILLRDALNKLDKEEKELILKRYFYNMTQSEIAKQIGVNQVKVSREEGKVLTKLRNYIN